MAGNLRGVFDQAQHARESAPDTSLPPARPGMSPTARRKGMGKKNNPDWKGYFLQLRETTHTRAGYLVKLKRKTLGVNDLSELTEKLLSEWIEANDEQVSR